MTSVNRTIRRFASASAAIAVAWSVSARAEIDVRALAKAFTSGGAPSGHWAAPNVPAIISVPPADDPRLYGLPKLGANFSAVSLPFAELDLLSKAHPTWQVTWSPPFHPLMDKVATWTHASAFRNQTGLTGKGVFVGILDTGVDGLHPDLRNVDGTTRIAYLIDYGSKPLGKEPDAEAQCSSKEPCSVLSKADIDKILTESDTDSLTTDTEGHGTHVASLAAGNGGAEKKYVGMAPEASIVIARVVDSSNSIGDAAILSAANLVFWLADRDGKAAGLDRIPAVLNLSLGSDFGPHDGTTALERGLSSLVGPSFPGRAIVVAAGNSAALYDGSKAFPAPAGVHTEVSVPARSTVLVPIETDPPSPKATKISATVYAWVAFRPGDSVSVAVEDRSGRITPLIAPGNGWSSPVGTDPGVTIVNGPLGELGQGFEAANAAAVIIDGDWASDQTFAIHLEGTGTANVWIQGEGDLSTDAGGIAAFPAATLEGTVTIPAANGSLIAVGATLNRTEWTDRLGDDIELNGFGGPVTPPLDSIAYFSSAGPTTDLRIKPDLVAPGAFVVGAMSRDADPATNPSSIFGEGWCEPAANCAVVDPTHAVTLGTSMSSPVVTGAVALLLQANPELTEDAVLTLLQAGARRPLGDVPLDSQLGAGALDLLGALDVKRAMVTAVVRTPDAAQSWMSLGEAYAHPDPTWSIPVMLQLRDSDARAADGFDAKTLSVDVSNGSVTEPLTRVAPGFYRFAVAADRDTGGAELGVEVRYAGRLLLSRAAPIGVDVNVVEEGFDAHGGCSLSKNAGGRRGAPAVLGTALIAWRGRRRKRAARTARSRGRRDN